MLAGKKNCTGCGSCAAVCLHHCINMNQDEEGFLYPVIEKQACISCKLCEQSCPVLTDNTVIRSSKTLSFAAQNKNEDIRRESSSGGIFSALALSVLEDGGAVCAAKYSDDYEVVHDIVTTKEDLRSFYGAKYSQSKAWHCFIRIKEMLQQGRRILFIGTPCQVAGLKAFLNRPFKNLILIDMVCHGVPSPLVWNKYLEERRQQDADGAKISAINLRDKSTGWSNYNYSVRFDYKNGRIYSTCQQQDKFMQGFIANLYLRPSCSRCIFKGIERASDITLGDYWGVWMQHPKFDDNMGTSLVMIHSDKGKKVWDTVEDQFKHLVIDNDEAAQYNPSILQSSIASEKRETFFRGIQQEKTVSDLVQCCLSDQNNENMSIIKKIMYKVFNCR